MLEHYSTANFLNKSTNRSQIFLEFIVTELPECLKQTKNNTPAKKAFLALERKDGSVSHYRDFCRAHQRYMTNEQTQEPQKPLHHEWPSDPPVKRISTGKKMDFCSLKQTYSIFSKIYFKQA